MNRRLSLIQYLVAYLLLRFPRTLQTSHVVYILDRPVSDYFALVPRAYADQFFDAISAFYDCDNSSWLPPESWWQVGCMMAGFEESMLFRYLHAADIPYRHYPRFEFNLVRGASGGVCNSGGADHRVACTLLNMAGALSPAAETG